MDAVKLDLSQIEWSAAYRPYFLRYVHAFHSTPSTSAHLQKSASQPAGPGAVKVSLDIMHAILLGPFPCGRSRAVCYRPSLSVVLPARMRVQWQRSATML